jgi:hypothetical protein
VGRIKLDSITAPLPIADMFEEQGRSDGYKKALHSPHTLRLLIWGIGFLDSHPYFTFAGKHHFKIRR